MYLIFDIIMQLLALSTIVIPIIIIKNLITKRKRKLELLEEQNRLLRNLVDKK